ncbi:MAG: S8 family serine peptidase, partial [Candidatus Sericytochromatia bacterium]
QKPLNYGKLSGTSMAAPHVAGLVGLILSQKPNLKPAEVKNVLESSSKDLGDKGWDKYFGAGRIDALESLKSVQ